MSPAVCLHSNVFRDLRHLAPTHAPSPSPPPSPCPLSSLSLPCHSACAVALRLSWKRSFRVDPAAFSLHKPALLNSTHGFVYLTTKHVQRFDHFKVNGGKSNLTALPSSTSEQHGSFYYRKSFQPNSWWWG